MTFRTQATFRAKLARLFELRRPQFQLSDVPDEEVQRVIQQNRSKKEAYSKLLTELEQSLKRQLCDPAGS
jgi:hypothetical protein